MLYVWVYVYIYIYMYMYTHIYVHHSDLRTCAHRVQSDGTLKPLPPIYNGFHRFGRPAVKGKYGSLYEVSAYICVYVYTCMSEYICVHARTHTHIEHKHMNGNSCT